MTDDRTISQEKAALRRQVIARRDALNPDVRMQKSASICQEVIRQLRTRFESAVPAEKNAEGIDGESSRMTGSGTTSGENPVIGLFSALGSEVDLRGVVEYAQRAGWRTAFPVMLVREEAPGYAMVFVYVDYETALLRKARFLAKPAQNIAPESFDFRTFPLVNPNRLDALVMPLVAFDEDGGRLGYGGGNYDRYLPQLRTDCWVSGVAFDEQCVPQVPRGTYDLAIPQVIHA